MNYLSHYTSKAGFEGIARSQTLWGTNFLDLNDKSEFLYALKILMLDAAGRALEGLPAAQKRADYDMNAEALKLALDFRSQLKNGDGYGHLYVTSFARAANDDQQQRGILTLWDRYTRHEGYALQFAQEDLERMLRLDSWRSNYASLGFAEVRYGVDRQSCEYKELRDQMTRNLTLQMLRVRPDLNLEPEWEGMWAESVLAQRMLHFCAVHKDPCFEDEREVRLFGYPLAQAEARIFIGIAGRKQICVSPSGKRYIQFGENWRPGISPRRIIVGTKADSDIGAIVAQFPAVPEVLDSNLPIA